MADDRQLREMTCDPKFRKVLVTDGKTAVGQAVVRAFIDAGAEIGVGGLRRALEDSLPGLRRSRHCRR